MYKDTTNSAYDNNSYNSLPPQAKKTMNQKPKIIAIPTKVWDILFKDPDFAKLLSLYNFYSYCATYQQTSRPKVTNSFVAQGLQWSMNVVKKYKRKLAELGILTLTNSYSGHIKLNYVVFKKDTVLKMMENPENSEENTQDSESLKIVPNSNTTNNNNNLQNGQNIVKNHSTSEENKNSHENTKKEVIEIPQEIKEFAVDLAVNYKIFKDFLSSKLEQLECYPQDSKTTHKPIYKYKDQYKYNIYNIIYHVLTTLIHNNLREEAQLALRKDFKKLFLSGMQNIEYMKDAEANVVEQPENVTNSPESVTVSPENVTNSPESVTVSPNSVTVSPENVTNSPESGSSKFPKEEVDKTVEIISGFNKLKKEIPKIKQKIKKLKPSYVNLHAEEYSKLFDWIKFDKEVKKKHSMRRKADGIKRGCAPVIRKRIDKMLKGRYWRDEDNFKYIRFSGRRNELIYWANKLRVISNWCHVMKDKTSVYMDNPLNSLWKKVPKWDTQKITLSEPLKKLAKRNDVPEWMIKNFMMVYTMLNCKRYYIDYDKNIRAKYSQEVLSAHRVYWEVFDESLRADTLDYFTKAATILLNIPVMDKTKTAVELYNLCEFMHHSEIPAKQIGAVLYTLCNNNLIPAYKYKKYIRTFYLLGKYSLKNHNLVFNYLRELVSDYIKTKKYRDLVVYFYESQKELRPYLKIKLTPKLIQEGVEVVRTLCEKHKHHFEHCVSKVLMWACSDISYQSSFWGNYLDDLKYLLRRSKKKRKYLIFDLVMTKCFTDLRRYVPVKERYIKVESIVNNQKTSKNAKEFVYDIKYLRKPCKDMKKIKAVCKEIREAVNGCTCVKDFKKVIPFLTKEEWKTVQKYTNDSLSFKEAQKMCFCPTFC